MTDFANLDRAESFFKPCQTHLDVYVRLRKTFSKNMGAWNYRLKIFCNIPVLLFQCESKGCNILLHLNFPLLAKLSTTSWLQSDHITFLLFLSDASLSNVVVAAKAITLSKSDSDQIRNACNKQREWALESIEDLVDIVYQQNIDNIWPTDC